MEDERLSDTALSLTLIVFSRWTWQAVRHHYFFHLSCNFSTRPSGMPPQSLVIPGFMPIGEMMKGHQLYLSCQVDVCFTKISLKKFPFTRIKCFSKHDRMQMYEFYSTPLYLIHWFHDIIPHFHTLCKGLYTNPFICLWLHHAHHLQQSQ